MEGITGTVVPNGSGLPARGTGVLPRWELVTMEGMRGTAIPNGPGPPTGGTENLAQVAVRAYGGHAGDSSSQTARANRLEGTGSPPRAAVRAYGGPAGDGRSQTAWAH